MKNVAPIALAAAFFMAAGCNGTTGDELVQFTAFAEGAPGAGRPFDVGGFRVQLLTAKMHVGALYFDESPAGATGFDSPVCIAAGVYAAQVAGPVEVDLLSPTPEEFSVYGNGSADTALSFQIWLTDGDVNEANRAHMVDLEGVATRLSDGAQFSFGSVVTINGDNRVPTASDPSQPGLNPLCKQRILQVGPIDVTFSPHGKLFLTIDPRAWFDLNLDFSTLPLADSASCLATDTLAFPLVSDPSDYAHPVEGTGDGGSCGASAQPCCAAGKGASSANGGCETPLTCTSPGAAGVCGPTYCIPDTSFAAGAGALQGADLFVGIETGGSAAYSVRYEE